MRSERMKLSELTTEQAADVLCEITPFISNITGDKELLDELGNKFDTKGKSVAELYTFAAKKVAVLAPIILKTHRDDLFGILSVLNETDAEQIAKQNVLTTMKQIKDAISDKELLDFFGLSRQEEETK